MSSKTILPLMMKKKTEKNAFAQVETVVSDAVSACFPLCASTQMKAYRHTIIPMEST